MTKKNYTIAEHYDTSGIITRDSDPVGEFMRWRQFAKDCPDWTGEEFTLEQFIDYILDRPRLAASEADPCSIPELMRLFPTLAPLAAKAEKEVWVAIELLNAVSSRDLGTGAIYAAQFIASGLDTSSPAVPIRRAISRWDSAHRAGFAEAAARLATLR